MDTWINTDTLDAPERIARAIEGCLTEISKEYSEIVFLCIGSDRVTGDCLGPLIGQMLQSQLKTEGNIYGTLTSTVHACNLKKVLAELNDQHPHALVIAVDASFGSKKHLGYASIADGALFPGAGVHKKLPPVGDLHISGIVCTAASKRYLALQTARLSSVIALSDRITQGILLAIPALQMSCSIC